MKRYDPEVAPDPKFWLSLDEGERILQAEQYHRRARIRLPNHHLHAMAHAIVEAQVAEGDGIPVEKTLKRLMTDGLNRHDALHAVGCVLMDHIYNLLKSPPPVKPGKGKKPAKQDDINAPYYRDLASLTVEGWLKRAPADDGEDLFLSEEEEDDFWEAIEEWEEDEDGDEFWDEDEDEDDWADDYEEDDDDEDEEEEEEDDDKVF